MRIRGGYAAAAPLAGLIAACTVGPDFQSPAVHEPAHWSEVTRAAGAPAPPPGGAGRVTEQSAELARWWEVFRDPGLSSLIERVAGSNLDVHAAVLRIEEARTERAGAAAGLWPAVSADASYTRQRLSDTTPTGSLFNSIGSVRLPGGGAISIPNPYDQYQLSAGAAWELDLFGRVRRSVEAADAAVQVSVEDQRLVLISMLCDVAQGYARLRGAQTRLGIVRENLAVSEELLDLTRHRQAAGLTTHIDVSNATAQTTAMRAELPVLEQEITLHINQLSELVGREPGALRAELEPPGPVPSVAGDVSIGVTADLARRRPDIREAEASLHAATAEIGLAVAGLYPRLTLSATGGFQSQTTGNLISWASRFASFGPALDLPVFDRGRWTTVRLYRVRAREAALAYQHTVLSALHEVENSAAAYRADLERRAWLDATVVENRDALMLSRLRYENGVISFIEVLDAERTLEQNALALADSTTAASVDLAGLYRSLGGGWKPPASPDSAELAR